jgi:outer membrane biogenesis lipoprotein LolB
MMKAILLILASTLLLGCGASSSDDPREETVGAEIASGYNQQMQRAQDVQLELEAGKRDLDAAIEASDQGRRDP